jgi:hypothetical protein
MYNKAEQQKKGQRREVVSDNDDAGIHAYKLKEIMRRLE